MEFNFRTDDVLNRLLNPEFNLKQYLKPASTNQSEHFEVPETSLSSVKTLGGFTVNFQINNFSYKKNSKGKFEIQSIQGNYLIKKNN